MDRSPNAGPIPYNQTGICKKNFDGSAVGDRRTKGKKEKEERRKGEEGLKVFSPRQPDTAVAVGDRGRPADAASGP
ncbi:MAG: hypothetical protein ACKPKO_65460, partial [Candidatus Fonsibacter sp.]